MKTTLGDIIYELADAQNLGIGELSEQVPHTTASTFSKIRAGQYSRIDDERLHDIAVALAPNDKATQALVACAYLQDMCPRNFRHLVAIQPKKTSTKQSALQITGLNEQLEKIAEAAAMDDSFLAHLQSLSQLADAILTAPEPVGA